jgi:hypothetical protein
MGDLFFSPKTDTTHLAMRFNILKKIKPESRGFGQYALLVMSNESGQARMD